MMETVGEQLYGAGDLARELRVSPEALPELLTRAGIRPLVTVPLRLYSQHDVDRLRAAIPKRPHKRPR